MARRNSLWPPLMPLGAATSPVSPAAMLATIVVVVGALYLGREILIPLALAILLSFMLAPVVIRLRRWGLGRIPAVLAVVMLLSSFLILLAINGLQWWARRRQVKGV